MLNLYDLENINNELDEEGLKNFILNNENITNYIYHFRIRYYDKVFRNNDIYGVYPDLSNLPDFVKEIKMDYVGSPFGIFISDKKIIEEDKVDNINYTLKIKKNIIDISKSPIRYTELVDYYEIIYKTIDLESKEFESTKTILNVVIAIQLSGLFTLIFHRLAKIDLSYFKDKKFLKRDKKELLENTKILLEEIGKNEELRQQFNIEMSKHKDIFIKYGLELPKETIDSNIKKKLLGGK